MKRLILTLVALASVATLRAQTSVEAAAAPTADQPAAAPEVRSEWLSEFSAVDLRGPMTVRLVRVPDTEAPRILFDAEGAPSAKFRAEVRERVLRLTERADARRAGTTSVTVYYNTLASLFVSDAAVRFEGTFAATLFDLRIEGGALVEGDLDVRDLAFEGSGKCRATLSGRVDYLTLALSTGDFSSYGLEARSVDASVSGSGKVEVRVGERLVARTTTGGKVGYKGQPSIVRDEAKFMGGGTVRVE